MACLCGGVIAGCGSSGPSPKPASQEPGARTGEASKSPDQILADAAAALRKAGSYRLQATLIKPTPQRQPQRIRMSVEVFSAHAYLMSGTVNGLSVKLISAANKAYIEADEKFWSTATHNPSAGVMFAHRWFVAPASAVGSLASIAGKLSPSKLAGCLLKHHGRLSIGGETTVDHQPAVLLDDAGNRPGGRRRTLAVATTGVPYPLQVTTTGKQRPGGSKGPCSSRGSSASAVGTVTLSGFGQMGKLQLPKHPLSMKSLNPDALAPTAPNT